MNNDKKQIVEQDFSQILKKKLDKQPKEGEITNGNVVDIINEKVIVDVGLKTEGIIPISQFKSAKKKIKVHDIIEVFIERLEDKYGNTQISFERVAKEKSWNNFEKAVKEQKNIKGKIIGKLMKGGYAVEIEGILAFLPGSHLDIKQIKDPSSLFHIEEEFKVLKIDRAQGNIVVSRKAILEESRKEAKQNMLLGIKEGIKLKGIVKNITNYGAFIDLGEIDGLLHMSDISWNRISHPTEILTLGETVDVMVIKYNHDTQRVSLGMKQLTENPWEGMEQKFKINSQYQGIVSEINDFGVFVEMEDNKKIVGLIYPNEISWNTRRVNPRKSVEIGQKINIKILEIDIKKHRLSLSMKKCLENPWEQFITKYPEGTRIKTKIIKILDAGLLVNVTDKQKEIQNLHLLIPATELDWNYKPQISLLKFKIGDIIECIVMKTELEKEKIVLSIKRLIENDIKKIANKIMDKGPITCKVTQVTEIGLKVEIEDGIKGFIKKYDISKEKSQQNPDRFTIGDRIDAKAIGIDKVEKQLKLSIKQLEIDEEKKAISEYGSVNSGATLAEILGAAIESNKKNK